MSRAKHVTVLSLGGFLLGAVFILLALEPLFPGERSAFPFYVWLVSLPLLPFAGYACSAGSGRSGTGHRSGGWWWLPAASATALLAAGAAWLFLVLFF